jgi:hypothetical protein
MLVPPAWVIEKANRRREQGDINQPSLWINEYPIPTKDDGFDQRNPARRLDHVTWPIFVIGSGAVLTLMWMIFLVWE